MRSLLLVALGFLCCTFCFTPAYSQMNEATFDSSGLVLNWQANIGGSPLAHGNSSFVIWPHSQRKLEQVRVKVGGRLIGAFRGDEIDESKLESAVIDGTKDTKLPRLGLEGAKVKAEKLAKTYRTLGKEVTIESEAPNLTYLITLSASGFVTAMNAETGAVMWQNRITDASLPMFGPGVSDDYVVVVNGQNYFVFDLENGSIISNRRLQFIATGSPTVIDGKAMVPSVGGRLVAYDIKEPLVNAPQVIRVGGENRLGLTVSHDRKFVSWPADNRLIIAKTENGFSLWNAVQGTSAVVALPAAVDDGFVFCTQAGRVIRTRSSNRENAMAWRTDLGIATNKSPVVGKKFVAIVSDDGYLFLLNLTDGKEAWSLPVRGINSVLGISESKLYAIDAARQLVMIDVANGKSLGHIPIALVNPMSNSINDRLYVCSNNGQITCLREVDASLPTMTISGPAKTEDSPGKPVESTPQQPPPATPAEDPFGSSTAESTQASDDPFATKDPF